MIANQTLISGLRGRVEDSVVQSGSLDPAGKHSSPAHLSTAHEWFLDDASVEAANHPLPLSVRAEDRDLAPTSSPAGEGSPELNCELSHRAEAGGSRERERGHPSLDP